ncbi:type II secretion system protein [Poseidonibacter antarcticus]|uniref:type II secretion system protein n=1 Tax=Poseidonibacter antarcticus TaxID=2478538 RepID=UPI000EF488C1|nr:type II secretion system protein [Poseidonibacter antarcticus]
MKNAFSLLELIFAIVVIGIISSFAIPKYLDTKNSAVISTIKRDIATATTSIQSYYLVNNEIDKISDAVTLNEQNWTIEDLKVTYKENENNCVVLEVKKDDDGDELTLSITPDVGPICKKLNEDGIIETTYDLY